LSDVAPALTLPAGDRDREALARCRPVPAVPRGHERSVVRKPWGHEFLCYRGPRLAAWVLTLTPGARTSLHCHRRKRTTLCVVEGELRLEGLGDNYTLRPGDVAVVEPGAFHRLSAGSDGARVVEIEDPVDKEDLVRIEDDHGRVGTPYEGEDATVRVDLDRFGFFEVGPETTPVRLLDDEAHDADGAALVIPCSAGRLAVFADGR